MAVRVMWSEASRRDAHNLDDLYERWRMRREELTEEQARDLDRYSEIIVQSVEVHSIYDLTTCEQIRNGLLESSNYLQGKIVEVKRELSTGLDSKQSWLLKTRISELKHLTFKVGLEVGKVNTRRKELNVAVSAERDKAYIGFLRNSLVGILETMNMDDDFDCVAAIEQILNHSFEVGDPSLFRSPKQ